MSRVLVTGGAGYIGSYVVEKLLSNNFKVTVIDDLSTGNSRFLHPEARFIKGSILDTSILRDMLSNFEKENFIGAIHLAGIKYASESVKNPTKFYETNCVGTLKLVFNMLTANIRNLVFASSCSVYGQPLDTYKVNEKSVLLPISPYGKSKLISESIINTAISTGDLNAVSLRYFNVLGAKTGQAVDLSPHNLLPNIYRAISMGKTLKVFGNNLDTPDGTAVRDYVDVETIADLHVRALMKLVSGNRLNNVYNLGSGNEISINQIISTAMTAIAPFKVEYLDARPGDPQRIVANSNSASSDLNWIHVKNLEDMILSGWNAWNHFHKNLNRVR
jgi:UDP-glucose 4-epimerase